MAKRHSGNALADARMSIAAGRDRSAAPFAGAVEHLWAELARLDLMLERQAVRLRAMKLINESEFRGLYLSESQVDALLNREAKALDEDTQFEEKELRSLRALASAIEQARGENDARLQATSRNGEYLPLVELAHFFNLTCFETEVVLLGMAPEIDVKYQTLYAYVQNDVMKKHPTVDLALQLCCRTRDERAENRLAFSSQGALLRHELVRLFDDAQDRDPALLSRFIKVDQRICDFVLGHDGIDSRLDKLTRRIVPLAKLRDLPIPGDLKGRLALASQATGGKDAVFFFHGPDGVGKKAAAEAICTPRNMALLIADLRMVTGEQNFAQSIALLRREATLQRAALYLDHFETLLTEDSTARERQLTLISELERPGCTLFIGSDATWHRTIWSAHTPFMSFQFPLPDFDLRLKIWNDNLDTCGWSLDGDVDLASITGKMVLSGGQIADAVRAVTHRVAIRETENRRITMDDLHASARDQSNHNLSRLAQKIEPLYTWSDIVLPPRALQQLREVCASVMHRHIVHSCWGFDRKLSLGKGLNVLFSGQSGTGKTMAAQILAHELSLDLYKIDLSSVISKYIGETEQNLSRIFREAESSNSIIFFDEADALFGKRSEVKDAHDRYANIEVAYLLQKMEEYEGIVILATNLSKNLDDAFARRMRHTIEFPFPDAIYREHIWRNIFPSEAPRGDDVDLSFLAAQFELSGGNIRNIALSAAFLAAEQQSAIAMEHLILSTAREMQKIGRLPSKANFRHYYELIRERG